jgi:hypothetical protein
MLVLGPVVDQQKEPGRGQTLDQAVEQGLRLGIDPVQVLNPHEAQTTASGAAHFEQKRRPSRFSV